MQKILSLLFIVLMASSIHAQDILGCTDPNAPNYNPSATADDGSCCDANNWATVTTNTNTYIHIWGVNSGYEAFIQTTANTPYGFCLPNACYLFEAFGSDPAVSTNIIIERNNIVHLDVSSLFTNVNGNFSVNSISGCPDPNACNYDPTTVCPDWIICSYDCQGCTDPTADNFDPEAQFDNGTCCYNLHTVLVEGNHSWYVSNSLTYYTDGGTYNGNNQLCVEDGCFFINMYTENPNTPFSVVDVDGNILVEGTTDANGYGLVDFGENTIVGCTDPYACNYTSEANCLDYALCDYGCYGCTDPQAPNFNANATIENGTCCYNNYYTIEVSADAYWSAGSLLASYYNYASGFYPTNNWFCIPDGCFQVSVFSVFPEAVSFTIYNADETIFYTGSTDASGQALINFTEGDVYGCTDFNACNYDPQATCSDYFACNYDCYGCTDPNAPNYDPTATIDNSTCCVNDWYTIAMTGAGYFQAFNNSLYIYTAGNYPQENGFCMNTSCFAIQVYSYDLEVVNFTITNEAGEIVFEGTTNEFGYFIGTVSPADEIAGCTDMNACNYNPNATCNSVLCEYYCGGCTDPTALNFNPYAWYEDGSCFYTIEPPMMQLQTETMEAEEVYYVRMDVMSVGNGAPYIMMNSLNTQMNMIEENGQYYVGPFPCGESVNISLHSAEYGMMEYAVTDPLEGACSVTSVEIIENVNTISSFPNPTSGQLTLTGIADGNWQINITDITGRVVLTNRANTSNGRIELDLTSLAVGQYQVTLTNATEMQTTKVLIQR